MADFWDTLGTRIGDVLIQPQTFGSLMPAPTDPAQRQAMITNALFSLGGTLSQAAQNRTPPMAAIGQAFGNLQQQGAQRGQQQLQNALLMGKLGEQKRRNETREALKKNPGMLAALGIPAEALGLIPEEKIGELYMKAAAMQRDREAIAGMGGFPGMGPAAGGGGPAPATDGGGFNVGNIRKTGGGFQTFGTPEEAVSAVLRNVSAYPKAFNQGQPMTLMQIGERWAPKGDGANDPAQWARNVASVGGLAVDQPLDFANPDVAARFARGVHAAEFGQKAAYQPDVYDRGVKAFLGGTGGPSPVVPVQATAPGQGPQAGTGGPAIDAQRDPEIMEAMQAARVAEARVDLKGFLDARAKIAARMVEMSKEAQARADKPPRTEIVELEDGKWLVDKDTGRKVERVGDRPTPRGEGREFTEEDQLRKEYTTQTKPFQEVRSHYQRIVAANEKPSSAGDIAMVYGFMKMLDPTSVVREGEFATAANAGGIDDRIRTVYNKIISGERLTPEVRKDFMDRAARIFDKAYGEYEQIRGVFHGLAKAYGRNPDRVVPDYTAGVKRPTITNDAPEDAPAAPPAAGQPKVIRYDSKGKRID